MNEPCFSQAYRELSDVNVELESLNNDFADVSYVCGWYPTSKDTKLFDLFLVLNDELARWPHLNRWYINIKSFTREERLAFPAVEAPLTSLEKKITCLKGICCISKNMLDKKVRQLVACKQSCHKLSMVNVLGKILSLPLNNVPFYLKYNI